MGMLRKVCAYMLVAMIAWPVFAMIFVGAKVYEMFSWALDVVDER